MDKAVLVNVEIAIGAEILHALDEADLQVKVAAWLQLPKYRDWRLILASREFEVADVRDAHGLIRKALNLAGFPIERTPTILPMGMSEPLIRGLRKIIAKTKNIEGVRLGGQTIGGRFVEDGYVYRIS